MIRHQTRWLWLTVALGVVCGGYSLTTTADGAQKAQSKRAPSASAVTIATTTGTRPSIEPPPLRPMIRPLPITEGPVKHVGEPPKTIRNMIESLWLTGKGEVTVEGEISLLRLAGTGSFTVDSTATLRIDPASSATRSTDGAVQRVDAFTGTAHVEGTGLKFAFKGDRVLINATGNGKVSMKGDGMFRVIKPDRQILSGVWSPTGVTQEFRRLAIGPARFGPTVNRFGPTYGLLPTKPYADAKVYEIPKLPSEGGATKAPTTPTNLPPVAPAPPQTMTVTTAPAPTTGALPPPVTP